MGTTFRSRIKGRHQNSRTHKKTKKTKKNSAMDSVKNKMESLVKDKEEATKLAETLENDRVLLDEKCQKSVTGISNNERDIAKLEMELDDVITATASANEKLEVASKTASDAELGVSALVRRVQLLEEETKRVTERLAEVVDKLGSVEKSGEEHERTRKILETQSFQNEEKMELLESQLEEAKAIAEDADRKQDEISRKLRIVEAEHDRIVDRCEEFESKSAEFEIKVEESRMKLKELEDLSVSNGTKEDKYEEETKKLYDLFKNAESNAEFGERSVEKLESTIDGLQESLFNEKHDFIELSKRLDQTLNDMMEVQ